MNTRIVTLSAHGQTTIPKIFRYKLAGKRFLLEFRDGILFLKPCRIVVQKKNLFASQALLEKVLQLSDFERKIYDLIRKKPCSADFLIQETSLGVRTVNVLLGQLEFQELITRNRNFLWVTRDIQF